MHILLATPAAPGSLSGNRVTAERWARIFAELGCQVTVSSGAVSDAELGDADLLVALHARKSAALIERFAALFPHRPLIVILTGTDLYADLPVSAEARRSLELATLLVALQPLAVRALPPHLAPKVRTIVQSAVAPVPRPEPLADSFEVVVSGHLREVKDPFRTALAARLLPAASRLRVSHLGEATSPEMEEQARSEMAENPRYHWLGALPRNEALETLARARLLSHTSLLEGGANVLSEAFACGVPVVASRIDGNTGLLGEDHPGLFPVGDTEALAALLRKAETDADFYAELQRRSDDRAPLVTPEREREGWRGVLEEISRFSGLRSNSLKIERSACDFQGSAIELGECLLSCSRRHLT